MAARGLIQRAIQLPSGQWCCPHCTQPIRPPMIATACIKDREPHYWQMHYECTCGTRYAIAATVNLHHIDPELTATMPIRYGIPPVIDPQVKPAHPAPAHPEASPVIHATES